jgi:hypothetical protein
MAKSTKIGKKKTVKIKKERGGDMKQRTGIRAGTYGSGGG